MTEREAENSSFREEANAFYKSLRQSLASAYEASSPGVREAWRRRQQSREDLNQDAELTSLEEEVKGAAIHQLITERFPGIEKRDLGFGLSDEQAHIIGVVSKEFEVGEWRHTDRKHSLESYLRLGLNGIRKRRRKERRVQRVKKLLSFFGLLTQEFITLLLVLGMYGVFHEGFQRLVISILLILYAFSRQNEKAVLQQLVLQFHTDDAKFLELRSLLGKPPSVEDQELMRSTTELHKRLRTNNIIHGFSLGIIQVIAIWQIIRALDWI